MLKEREVHGPSSIFHLVYLSVGTTLVQKGDSVTITGSGVPRIVRDPRNRVPKNIGTRGISKSHGISVVVRVSIGSSESV
jgi:hypothetical protein